MNCPNCQTNNPDGAKFCMSCGTPLIRRCTNCQTELPPQARFCMNCGTPVSDSTPATTPPVPTSTPKPPPVTPPSSSVIAPPSEVGPVASTPHVAGERRVVTVMFADISGFTAMSENMDPEQVRSLMNKCFDHLVPIVEKYEGVVDKFIGDEIMALFGAPIAHEDDPARALRTALDMMETLSKFNAENGTDLGMHAGINTGLVVAGGIGSQGRQQYSVMGDVVNLASRLEGASERGEILVGPDTYRRAAPLFEFETLDPIKVKGKSDAIQIYKVLSVKAEPGHVRGLSGLESPMVGRDAEFKALLDLSQAVKDGHGRTAIIIGEAGLGKSRLTAEWRATTRAIENGQSQLHWAEGRCLSYGQGLAYHLLIDLLRALINVPAAAEEPEARAGLQTLTQDLFGDEAGDVYPYLGHLLSLHLEGEALEKVQRLDPQTLQAQYLAALRRLLETLAQRKPLGLIFEDTHWADPSSTDLLIKLLPLIKEVPILFCFVTRPDRDVPGWKLVTAARDLTEVPPTELNLHTLSDNDSRQLIANLLEIESLPENVRNLILKRAEGNPFFVEEVIRMLIDRGAILKQGNRWFAQKEIETVEIPDNLQGLLLARIDRLPDDVKHTLRVASVIGRQFSVRVLEEVLRGI